MSLGKKQTETKQKEKQILELKIGFSKIRMIRKKPLVVLQNELGNETNRNETKRKTNIEKSIYKNLPAEEVTFFIKNKHKKNCRWNWAERMKKEYMLAKDEIRVKCGKEWNIHIILEKPCQAFSIISSLNWH